MIGRNVRKIFWALAILLPACAAAQRGGATGTPIPTGQAQNTVVVTSDPNGAACSDNNVYIYSVNGAHYCCTSGTRQLCGATAALGLPSDPSACAANKFVTDQNTSGTLTCTQPAFTDLSGSATDAQIPDTITVNRTESKGIVLDAPTTSEDVTIWRTPVNITITALHCVLVGGTSLQYTIRYHTDRNNAGNQVVNGGTLCGSTTTGTANAGLSVAVTAGNWIWLETSTGGSGTVNNFAATITYTVP